jgi:hypothetical protein
MLSGENSILNQAGTARDRTEESQEEELAKLQGYANIIDEAIGGNGSSGSGNTQTAYAGLSTANGDAALPNGVTEVAIADVQNENLKDTSKIKAVIKGTGTNNDDEVPIPIDAKYKEGTENTGVVIEYKGSEFVWVPINSNLTVKGTEKLMARPATGDYAGTDANNRTNYQGALYDYSGSGESVTSTENTTYVLGTSNYREPDVLADTSYGDWSTNSSRGYALIKQYITGMSGKTNEEIQTQWTKQLTEEYNEMIESVTKYGGFFVGRYETSYNGTAVASVANVAPMSAQTASGGTWYGMYQKQKDFTTNTDKMKSAMIWGSQYDAMLNWVMTGGDKAHITATTYGNHNGSSAVNCGSYNSGSDKMNNIYDLEGNLYEWTQEALNTNGRVERGGYCGDSDSPSCRYHDYPYGTYDGGSRLALYVN